MPRSARIKKEIMAKYSKKNVSPAGLEKFNLYAEPRGFKIELTTYGIYKVVHNGKSSQLEAARAVKVNNDGSVTLGWIINIANRQRTFKPDGSGYDVYPLKK